MQRTLIAIGCALALAGSALAQQQEKQGSGPTLTERAKAAAQAVGDKTKEAAQKAKNAMQQSDQDKKAANPTAAGGRDHQLLQKRADADLKSARARCAASEQKAQRSLCEKQAAARYANAEVEIEKAKLAAQRNNTSTMGAGKSSR